MTAASAAPAARTAQRAQRRERFVQAAERLFLERGFAGASVNEVVRISGGSLATLYAEFPTKEALFEAVMNHRAATFFEGRAVQPAPSTDAVAELRALAARIQARMLSRDGLALYRIAVSEGPHFPSLRKTVLAAGMNGFLVRLAATLEQVAAAGRIAIDDPMKAAGQFLSLVQGQMLFAAACGDKSRTSRAARQRQIEEAVTAFLRIHPADASTRRKRPAAPNGRAR